MKKRSENEVRIIASDDSGDGVGEGVPEVGLILQRLRVQRGLSLKDVASASGLSSSFIRTVERGESDISLKRLARLARIFGHDVGSLLGYTSRRAKPTFVRSGDRFKLSRGKGVDYEVVRLPGVSLELIRAAFKPGASFRDEITHEGVDVGYVLRGRLVLVYDALDYSLKQGDCAIWSGAYPHKLRNDSDEDALCIFVVTETVY